VPVPTPIRRAARLFLRRRALLLGPLILLALWLPGADQGWLRTDSHYYAAIGLKAWREHSLWTLHAGDVPYLNKPPFAFWIHGLFVWLLGPTIWAARLPSLLAAAGACAAASHAVRSLSGRRAAMLAGFVLATTVEFFRYTRAISLDMWLVFFLALTVAIAAHAVRRNTPRTLLWAALPIGLALLTKPFIALFAPVLLALWLATLGRWRAIPWLALAALGGSLLAAPWHLSMASIYPGRFWGTYFFEQSLDRAAESARPWHYYLAIMAETYGPWLALLPIAIFTLTRRLFISSSSPLRHSATPPLPHPSPSHRLTASPSHSSPPHPPTPSPSPPSSLRLSVSSSLLTLTWCLGWFLAISFFGGKAGRYALPLYLLLGTPIALWLASMKGSRRTRRHGRLFFAWAGPLAITGSLAATIAIAAFNLRVHQPRDPAWDQLAQMRIESRNDPAAPALYTTPKANFHAANIYLLAKEWPRFLTDSSQPAIGDLIILDKAEAGHPVPAHPDLRTQQILEGESFVLVERLP
jgi:4-amino-4-deoxy-L-arabinose transferase-like glycosyltransferase